MVEHILKIECKKCQYVWFPRLPSKPKVCPRCKSYKWNEDSQNPLKNSSKSNLA